MPNSANALALVLQHWLATKIMDMPWLHSAQERALLESGEQQHHQRHEAENGSHKLQQHRRRPLASLRSCSFIDAVTQVLLIFAGVCR